ncbi:MAG: hypothetical protein JXA11_05865 [Phycisphaerae bacterium]|nr:hypothetical protein [Phycisphaerae bacterium]
MSTKIGIIAEGPIDHALLPPLLERIAQDRAGYDWPVTSDDVADFFFIRKKGHGGVLEVVRKLVSVLDTKNYKHAFFVILLDRRTQCVQKEIRRLLKNRNRFALGVAIEEIEAWWLADRENTLKWSGFTRTNLPTGTRYASEAYNAEKDPEPKKTLDELTRISNRFDRFYGVGNMDMATAFAEKYWRENAKLDAIHSGCPKGYGSFEKVVVNRFRTAKNKAGKPF